jgi:acetyltransferase
VEDAAVSLATLKGFFQPRSVAVIGASKLADSLGASVLRNLLQAEFDGPILPVNPKHDSVLGVRCYRSIRDLPVVPDLAVVCTPEDTLPGVVERLGRQGTRAAIVMSRARDPARAAALRSALLAAAAAFGVRLLGPGSDGIQVPSAKLNASWMVGRARPGNVSLISQSGSLIAGMLPWAEIRSIGFSHVISHGEGIDVVLGDLLDYVATDQHTHAVLLYLKRLYDSRKFLSAARALARIKPVIAIKPSLGDGETGIVFPGGQVLPGVDPDAVHDVAMQRAGMLRVRDIDELFDAAQTLTYGRRPAGERLVILGNGMGPAEMALGALFEGGGKSAVLSQGTREKLSALTSAAQPHSIVDIGRRATPARYHEAAALLLADPGVDALLVMHTETAVAPEEACAAQVIEAAKGSERFVLACWLGADSRGSAHRRFTEAGIANYPTPEKATRAFLHLVRYQRNQYLLRQTPATPMPDKAAALMRERARTIVASALAEGRRWLHEGETSLLLECYGIPALPARLASSPDDAVRLARELGFPVSLHLSMRAPASSKLDSEGAVREAAAALFADPGAELPGMPETRVVVHPAPKRPEALILMAGIASNPIFGRVIHLGPGGLQKSSSEGGALSLPPLNMALAEETISRTGIAHMQAQTFNRSGLDQTSLQALLVRLSDIAVDLPEVSVLQINPLLADRDGVLAQEVRLAIEPLQPGRVALAIRPYPSELEEELSLEDGSKVLARPVRPEDEPAYTRLLSQLSPEDVYSRFCRAGPVPREVALELIHIDYDREMTFVGTRIGPDGGKEIVGVVDSMTTPDNREAEYSIFVRSDLKGKGLGRALMEKMIRYCRLRGTRVLYGMVLKSNVAMLSLDFKLGFQPDLAPAEAGGDPLEKMVLQLA